MAKVYLMCGKLCSGKSTHSKELKEEHKAVVLSVDELTLAFFGQDAGDRHDLHVEKAKTFLYQKSLEILETGIDVILDWGFWTKKERAFAKDFYSSKNIAFELHYIEISEEEWKQRIEKRNQEVLAHKSNAYFVDEGLAEKFQKIFEVPEPDEIDVRIEG